MAHMETHARERDYLTQARYIFRNKDDSSKKKKYEKKSYEEERTGTDKRAVSFSWTRYTLSTALIALSFELYRMTVPFTIRE